MTPDDPEYEGDLDLVAELQALRDDEYPFPTPEVSRALEVAAYVLAGGWEYAQSFIELELERGEHERLGALVGEVVAFERGRNETAGLRALLGVK